MRKALTLAAIAGTMMTMAAGAQGQLSMSINWATTGGYQPVTFLYAGSTYNVNAGTFTAKLSDIATGRILETFPTYCVDLNDTTGVPATYNVNLATTPGFKTSYAGQVAWLYNTYAPTVTTTTQGAALQLAMWEALTDGMDGSLSNGSFIYTGSKTGAIYKQASTYLDSWQGQTSTATWLNATSHPSGTHQNMIAPAPTPEPGALAFGAASLGSLLAVGGNRWRRRRKP